MIVISGKWDSVAQSSQTKRPEATLATAFHLQFSLRTHDTYAKRVSQRSTVNRGLFRVLRFPPTGSVGRPQLGLPDPTTVVRSCRQMTNVTLTAKIGNFSNDYKCCEQEIRHFRANHHVVCTPPSCKTRSRRAFDYDWIFAKSRARKPNDCDFCMMAYVTGSWHENGECRTRSRTRIVIVKVP